MTDDLREYECIVSGVLDGKHGPYAVATCDEIEGGTITFSCKEPVWTEKHQPKPGDVVLLFDVYRRRGGWCARNARLKRPKIQSA